MGDAASTRDTLQRELEALRNRVAELERSEAAGKKVQETLIQANKEWERTFDTVPDLIAIIDTNHRIVRANKAMADRLGMTPEACAGHACYRLFHRTDEPPDYCPHSQLLKDCCEHTAEFHEATLGGDFVVSVSPIFDTDGCLAGSVHVVRDVSDRKRTEAALRDSEERFRLLYERAPIGYQSLDERGHILEVNQAWLDTLRYARQEVIGRWFGDFLTPECVEHFRRSFPCFKSAGEIHHVQFEMVRKDGSCLIVEYEGKIGLDDEGQFQNTHCVFHDITDRKLAEKELTDHREHLKELVEARTHELEQSRVQLRQAERMASIGTLAAGIAHEINNPIGGIRMAAQNVKELRGRSGTDPLIDGCLDDIISQAQRCSQVTRSVLQFARQQATEKWPSDLNVIVMRSVRLAATCVAEHDGETDLQLGKGIGPVLANPFALEQVFVNLIKNAVESGGRDVRIQIRTEQAAGVARIIVRDNGPGIPQAQLSRVFDPFYTTRQEDGGSGLGLSIVHGIISEHGGTVEVESHIGRGATFTLSLPLARETSLETHHGEGTHR